MKRSSFNLILGVFFALALCMMPSCQKEKTTGKIQGLVTNASTNEPIQGVNISLSPTGLSAVTGSDGRYEFVNLEVGQYTVKGEKAGYEEATKSVTIVAGNVSSGDMQLQPVADPGHTDDIVITDGLFCYFTFDDDEIVDYYGNFTGINSNAAPSTDTPSGEGKSLVFNGRSSSVLIQDNIVPSGDAFSINIWFKTGVEIGTDDHVLIGSDNHAGGNRCSALIINRDYNVRYFPNTSAYSWKTIEPITQYIDNQWHMLTLTYNGAIGTIYVDGSLFEALTSDKLIWGSYVTTSMFGADATNSTNGYFEGSLDNFRSYDRALTATEVQMLFNAKQ
jgi:hypothetical protein